MFILRLTQTSESQDKYHFEISLEGDGQPRQIATTRFNFKLTAQDQEDLRWYLEDFLQYPHDPAPKIAARIEKSITQIGVQLFKALFQSNDDTRNIWTMIQDCLNDTRIEMVTDVREATIIPWELIRDPKTDTPLALRARAFVRAHYQPMQMSYTPQAYSGPIRILLVICRPHGKKDVPFRSVASHLIKGLDKDVRSMFQLDVLRPPTFEQLGKALRAASAEGKPYHVVHFDGHGAFLNIRKLFKDWENKINGATMEGFAELSNIELDRFSPKIVYPRPLHEGDHGYLLFENPQSELNLRIVDGQELGEILAETGIPILVLNACRTAHAELQTSPNTDASTGENQNAKIRIFGSLAQEVMDAGVAGVVAMCYNVYVVTAAQFVANLYAALEQGCALGEAVTLGRKQLADNPLREIAFEPRPFQDWYVPVVYEATSVSLFTMITTSEMKNITLNKGHINQAQNMLDPKLPKIPDVGFFGRDETLLALDRAFDNQHLVLLHAFAGSGKTATAAEFARWYKLTGGIQGHVLFTSFEQYKPLNSVLDQIGQVFEEVLEDSGIHWLALNDTDRRSIALWVMKLFPVLWIWDNVESISGFLEGSDSDWNKTEQQEIADFLREACGTNAKFLLTSRRNEIRWLGNLPVYIKIPAMPMQEQVQLARALADKNGRKLTKVNDWRILLDFTQGNPLTIIVLVGQALCEGMETKEEIGSFVSKLRAREAVFEDEESEGRSKSLGASLSYGFSHAFNETERKQLALLHFFEGFVSVHALLLMGNPELSWCLPEVQGLTKESGIALLNRAARIGLLTSLGGGYYSIHPALPLFLRNLFKQYYPLDNLKAEHAFVESISWLGNYCHDLYINGNHDMIATMKAEESNLLHARRLALKYGWWENIIRSMLCLFDLYSYMGRKIEWSRLMSEIVPEFIDNQTDGPLPGREEYWDMITEYRWDLAMEAHQWNEAERLQRICVDRNRKSAFPFLTIPPDKLEYDQRYKIKALATSLHNLARIQDKLGKFECIMNYEESLKLAERIGDHASAANFALNIGAAYTLNPVFRDLTKAEQWYEHSLELFDERNSIGRAKCLGQLGCIAYIRFRDVLAANESKEEALKYLNIALRLYHQVLFLLPRDAVNEQAVTHNQLGLIYSDAMDFYHSFQHYRESIRYEEMQSNIYGAAISRYNVAFTLARAGRFEDALEYAYSALSNFQAYSDNETDWIKNTQDLIEKIEQDIKKKTNDHIV